VTPPHQERCPTCRNTRAQGRGCLHPERWSADESTDRDCPDPFHSNPLPSDPHEGGETWTIYVCPKCRKAVGVYPGGPIKPCCYCGANTIEVVPASTLQSLTAQRDEAIKERRAAQNAAFCASAQADAELSQLQAAHRADQEAINEALYALIGGEGPPMTTEAQLWLRATLPPDHPNYIDRNSLSTKDTEE
jgi:hypothetical protein